MAEFLVLKKEALIQKCKDLNLPHEGRGTEQMRSSLIQNAVDAAKRERERKYLEFLREKHRENRDREIEEAKAYNIKKMEIETRLRDVELQLQEVRAERLQMERRRLKLEEERKERNPDFRHEFPQVEPAGPENKLLGVMTTSAVDTFTGQQNSPTPLSVKENSTLMETEKNCRSQRPQKEMSIEMLHVSMTVYLAKVKAEEKASYEEFLKYKLEKKVNAETKPEVTVEVEKEKEESESSLPVPANKQASSDLNIDSSEEKKLSQNTCLLESVSEELEQVSAEETNTDTPVDTKVTVEVSGVGTEISKVNTADPAKENPEKLQSESILLGEEVEAKESRAQNTVLKEDIALQKEQKEIDDGVTETNVNTNERKTLSEVLIPCQNTEPLVAKRKAVLQNWEVLPGATYLELWQLTEVKQFEKQGEDTLHELCIFLRNVTYRLAMDKCFRVFAKPIDVHKVQDYVTVIKQPMDLSAIISKIDLICSKALEYNPDRDPEHCLIRTRKAQLVKLFPDRGSNKNKQPPSRDGHPRDDLSPADFKHPGDDLSPADGQPRDNINLNEDIT